MKINIDDKIRLIFKNIMDYGFYRYDPSNIRNLEIRLFVLKRFLQILEEFFPILLRRLLGIKKERFITAYSHIGEACLLAEKENLSKLSLCSKQMCDEIVKIYTIKKGDDIIWPYFINRDFFPNLKNNSEPTMPLHGLARANILLLKYGILYDNKECVDLAYRTAVYTINNHEVIKNEKGEWYISYLYNSKDCTLNVNTEFAQWLAMFPMSMYNSKFNEAVNGIVKLIINEQNENGSWYYFSKAFMLKYNIKNEVIDCHHTGTVLQNMIYVLKQRKLPDNLQIELLRAVNKGLQFFINNIFEISTGKAITLIGHKRPAGPVQYSEAIFAFYEYILLDDADNEMKNSVINLFPKIINHILLLIDKDGAAPSEKIIKWKNINSLRWGNTPALQALICYKSLKNKGFYSEK